PRVADWTPCVARLGNPSCPGALPLQAVTNLACSAHFRAMGATTSLASRQLSVTPGGSVDATVQVRNNGTLVDQFSVDVVGDAREWTEVEPRIINLMPGQDGQIRVKFAPPRNSSVPAGFVPFGVRVLSREEPHGSVVEEGAVQVEPFTDLQVELAP